MDILIKDRYFMQKAIEQANLAYKNNEIPIGSVVVDGKYNIIGAGFNEVENGSCQLFHAENLAIKQACETIKDWRLDGCTIYITLEPCVMCIGLICLSRIERIVYATKSPLFGYIDLLDISMSESENNIPDIYQKHIKGISRGIMSNEAEGLLKSFFKRKRGEGE